MEVVKCVLFFFLHKILVDEKLNLFSILEHVFDGKINSGEYCRSVFNFQHTILFDEKINILEVFRRACNFLYTILICGKLNLANIKQVDNHYYILYV